MNKFLSALPTTFPNQLGSQIALSIDDVTVNLNVFVCSIDGVTLKTGLEDSDELYLSVTVPEINFKQPQTDVSEDGTYYFVKFEHIEVHIKLADEGVVVDVWDQNDTSNGSLDSTYAFYDELLPEEDDEPVCRECGGAMSISDTGIANHLNDDGGIDYDADAQHVPLAE